METVELSYAPLVKRVVLTAFPQYRKRKAFVSVFHPVAINSYWDGGSRREYAVVEIATGRRMQLPTATHPFFDIVGKGIVNGGDGCVSVDHVGNVTLNTLPEGFALVEAGVFCGKAATAHVYFGKGDMPRSVEAGNLRQLMARNHGGE